MKTLKFLVILLILFGTSKIFSQIRSEYFGVAYNCDYTRVQKDVTVELWSTKGTGTGFTQTSNDSLLCTSKTLDLGLYTVSGTSSVNDTTFYIKVGGYVMYTNPNRNNHLLRAAKVSGTNEEVNLYAPDGIIIPIELSMCESLVNEDNVELIWRTVSETNNYGFYIERSKDNNWEEIGFVKGNGNSTKEILYSYVDREPLEVGVYYYRLRQVDFDGTSEEYKFPLVNIKAPENFELFQNYPNPFNPETNIKFNLKEKGHVKLIVYNILGQVIDVLVDKELEAGYHKVIFNARNLSSGVYIYKISVNNFNETKKMILIK